MQVGTILRLAGLGIVLFLTTLVLFFMYGEGNTPIINLPTIYRVVIWAVVAIVAAIVIWVVPMARETFFEKEERLETWEDKALPKKELEKRAWDAFEEENEEYLKATGWRLSWGSPKGRDAIVAILKKGGLPSMEKVIPIGESKFDAFSPAESHERHVRTHEENLGVLDSYAPGRKSEIKRIVKEQPQAEVKEG